jgi:mRNA-degrading endonuclease RelE of RelBE toxin-antitoxin system
MNKIEKLFRKISKKDRIATKEAMAVLVSRGNNSLNIKKIAGTNFFRARIKRFRIIFHHENGDIIIDDIRIRNENTYKNL